MSSPPEACSSVIWACIGKSSATQSGITVNKVAVVGHSAARAVLAVYAQASARAAYLAIMVLCGSAATVACPPFVAPSPRPPPPDSEHAGARRSPAPDCPNTRRGAGAAGEPRKRRQRRPSARTQPLATSRDFMVPRSTTYHGILGQERRLRPILGENQNRKQPRNQRTKLAASMFLGEHRPPNHPRRAPGRRRGHLSPTGAGGVCAMIAARGTWVPPGKG